MNKLYILIFLFAFQYSAVNAASSSKKVNRTVKKDKKFEDDILADLKEAMTAVFGAGKFVMDAVDTEKRDDGGRDVSATISLFDKGDVELSSAYSSHKRLEFIDIEFPEGSTIDFNLIDQLVDGKIKSFLPDGFPLEAGVWVKNLKIAFGETGYVPNELSATIASPSSWELLGAGSFAAEGVELSLEVIDPKAASREITGSVTATASIGNIPLEISASLSNNSSNNAITASIEQVNLKNLLEAIVGDESNTFLSLTPDVFKDLNLSKAEISIVPTEKELTISGTSSLGNVILDLNKDAGVQKVMLAISPPNDFKFSSLSSVLGALDGMDMSGSYFIISNKQRSIPALFFDKDAKDGAASFDVKKGFNLATNIALPAEVTEILKVKDISLVGSVPIDFSGIDLYGKLGLDLKFGDNGEVSFDEIGAGLSFNLKGELELSLFGAGSFAAGEDRVQIYGGIIGSVAPSGMTLELEAGLAAGGRRAEKPENCLMEQAEWTDPFGIPGTGIRALGIRGGIGTTFPYINTLGLTGNLRLGTVNNKNKHVCASVVAYTNLADLGETMIVAEAQNLTPLSLIEAFEENHGISGALRDALDTGIESAKLKIVPKEVELFGQTYSPGIALDSAKLKLAGLEGLIGFSFGENGIKAYGTMDPFVVEEGGFTFFSIEGARPNADGSKSGPSLSLGLDANDPHFKLNGSVTVLEIEREAFIKVDKNGFEFETSGKILDGALGVTAHIKAGEFTENSGLYAKVAFENKLQTMVADELIKFIETSSAEAQKAYKDAQAVLEAEKSGNDVGDAFIDLASGAVDAFSEMDKGLAVAGTYVVKGLLKDAINIKKLSFEGEVTSMKAKVEVEIDMTIAGSDLTEKVSLELNISEEMFVDLIVDAVGEDVIDFFGSLDTEIANAFEDLGAELETAFEDLGGYIVEGAEVVGETFEEAAVEVGAAFEDLGDAFEDAGEYMGEAFEDFGKGLELVFVGDSYAPSTSSGGGINIPFNHTLVTVTVDRIKVTDDEGDLWDDDLELYGNILVNVSSNMYTNAGATPYTWGKSMRNTTSVEEGSSTGVNHSKYFYVPNADLDGGNAWVQIISKVLEYNSNIDYDYLNGSSNVYISSTSGQISKSFSAGETRGNDETVSISYRVIIGERKGPPPPPPSRDQMIAASKTNNVNEINYLVSKGGNIKIENIIDEAIKANVSAQMIQRLMQGGNLVKSNHITLATNSANRNSDIINLLLNNGVRPNSDALMNEIGWGGQDNMTATLIQHKAVPQLKHVQKAISLDNVGMINLLMNSSNVQVTSNELQYAVNKNDLNLVKLFINRGGNATAAMITKSIEVGNIQMIDVLLKAGEADHTSLQAAANTNNASLFKALTNNRVRLTNNGPINTAIDKNNLDIVKLGLENGGSKSETLNYAVSKSNKAAMLLALERGANGTSALDYAVSKNDVAFFEQLVLNYSADANQALAKAYGKANINMGTIALKGGANPTNQIAAASTEGKLDWVKLLLSKKANPASGVKGAVENQHIEIAELLFDAGAKAKAPALLASAATNKNLPLVKLLVEKGDAVAENGRTIAIANNDVAMTKFLLENGAKATGVDLPASKGWLEMVKLLVSSGANPSEGIASSIQANHTDVAIFLLDNGANVGDYIKTSAYHGNALITAKLLEKGANPNDGSFNAVKYKHTNIMKMLIDGGADASKEELMHNAVKNFQEDMIVLLIENKGDLLFTDRKGDSYLHRVADKKGHDNLVQVFIDAKINIEAINNDGQTPLHLAVNKKNNEASVKALIDAGANVNAKNKRGKSVWTKSNKSYRVLLEAAGGVK